jgi:hypothetical protein
MRQSSTTSRVVERELPMLRARLIDLAAALDRIDRAGDDSSDDPRIQKIRQSLAILSGSTPGRAEQVQRVFSLPYEADWRKQYEL